MTEISLIVTLNNQFHSLTHEVCSLSDNVTGASNVELSETADESDMTIVVKSEHKLSAIPKPLNLLSKEIGW